MNYGRRFVTLYRRQGSRPSPWKRNAKRQNDRILKVELPRSVGAQYATGDQWRNNSRKNEGMEPKQKQDQEMTVAQIMNSLLPNSDLN